MEQEYLLVKLRRGLNPRQTGLIMTAIALLSAVECVFDASVTGLSKDRLEVITGEPTAAAKRRKVSLAG